MLPNHAPLRVAENFHTLAALHPDRIDLGLGRAPGTDPATSRMLRPFDAEQFPQQLQELLAVSRREFPPGHPFSTVRVIPEGVPLPPIWVLASSGATAAVAGGAVLHRPAKQVLHERQGNIIEHDRDDHFVRACERLQEARYRAPDHSAKHVRHFPRNDACERAPVLLVRRLLSSRAGFEQHSPCGDRS